MKRITPVLTLLCSLLLALSARGVVTPDPVPHPRLLLGEGEQVRIQEALVSQPVLRQADDLILAYCDSVLEAPVLERVLIGRRMLSTSRDALKRIFWLSYAWRVHGKEAYADRALQEMEAVCRFRDWNPSHFLDTGEMAMAVGIGYDWLYDRLTPERREFFCAALREKAFTPAKDDQLAWFYESPINWNPVCNAGLLFAALAIWDEHPIDAAFFVKRCIETNPQALAEYALEGSYPEGYNYWGYGTSFQIMLLSALQSAFGTDCGLLEADDGSHPGAGLLASGTFMQMMTTPTGRCWSFYDAYPRGAMQYMQAWMARQTDDPGLLWPELHKGMQNLCEERLFPMFLIEGSRLDLAGMQVPQRHTYRSGGTTPVWIYRSGWDSPDDIYLGVKAGLASSSHAHQDIGSFYFEADGVAWAADLGMQNYNSLESRGVDLWNMKQAGQRWEVFRIGPWSHNILTLDNRAPSIHQKVELGNSWDKGVEVDVQMPYWDALRTHLRRVWLDDADDLVVEDILEGGDSLHVMRWALCSEAEARIADNRTVLLNRNGHTRQLQAELTGDKAGTLEAALHPVTWEEGMDPEVTHLHDYDAANPDHSLTSFSFTLKPHEKVTLRVRLTKIR